MMQALASPGPIAAAHQSTVPVSTVLIDEETVILESLPQALQQVGQAQVIGRAIDVAGGLQICQAMNPAVLLVEDRSFRRDARLLAEFLPLRVRRVKLALFADRLTDMECNQAIAIAATGFFSKRDSIIEISEGLGAMTSEGRHVSRHLADRIVVDAQTGELCSSIGHSVGALTNLQLQVLVHLANGMRVREVARKMHLSQKAIESHKYRIMQRLGVHDRLGLCRWAIREGLIEA